MPNARPSRTFVAAMILSFALPLALQGQVFEKIFSFTEARAQDPNTTLNTGTYPKAALLQASDGNYYGTTSGGNNPGGTVFRLTPGGQLTTLVTFPTQYGAGSMGTNPVAALVQGSDGKFYGTTTGGGTFNAGTVFRMAADGTKGRLLTPP